ncbi:hypothetical protein [Paractinoplanes toevensis]|uniref:Uncharacterized protein n=1 Tax=Paractinoplanes toevensis TaxID=571911 RepID=A0A919W730_9ACTN|nr:hypothetical protein [Actinoplanes toevensis]GIM94068.1 hypothetical protein Ato02nite_058610 [Actinoplanes toevensis]
MLEAPGGGGGTPWESLTVDKMQELIQNPDTDKQWDLVAGWKKSAELISEHRWQVENYRDNLATAWPPAKSKAAEEYITRLNVMIDNLKATYEAALANYDAVSRATGSIYQAQVKMEKLYKEYKGNESLLADFTAKQEQAKSSPTPTPSPSPSGGLQPPVAAGRQEELRLQAAAMLSGVSSDLAQAQIKLVKPPNFKPLEVREDGGKPVDGTTYVAPPIPPIVPSFVETTTSTKSTRPAVTFPTSTATTAPAAVAQPGIGTQQPGLVLGGTQLPTPSAPTGISPISPNLPTGTGPISSPGLVSPPSPLLPGGRGTSLPTSPVGVGRSTGLPREGVIRPGTLPEGIRAMPAGGVIGGAPGAGLGQPAAGRSGTQRVNPVGGVIGEGQGTTGATRGLNGATGGARGRGGAPGTRGLGGTSVGGEHPMSSYGQGAGRKSSLQDEAGDTHWDPDNPWETAEGVDPVVLPAQEQRIDPGPAIGLH